MKKLNSVIKSFAQISGLSGIQTQNCLESEELTAPNHYTYCPVFTVDQKRAYHSSGRFGDSVRSEDEFNLHLFIFKMPMEFPASDAQRLRRQPGMR